MDSEKDSTLEIVSRNFDDLDTDERFYRQFVIQKILRGKINLEEGKVVSHEELLEMVEKWKI